MDSTTSPTGLSRLLTSIRTRFRPKSLDLLHDYSPRRLAADAMAGGTVALIALPLSIALGVASVPEGAATPFSPPAAGVFTAIIAGFLISAFGGSKVQIGGPTAAFVPILFLVIAKYGYDGLLLATMMAGVILILMGALGLGTLIKYIPYPVTSGFTTGIAVSIMVGQAPDFLGIRAEAPPHELFPRLAWLGRHLPDADLRSVLLASGVAALIWLWPRLGWRRVPGHMIALVLATAGIALFHGQEAGLATLGSRFGPHAIPNGLPPLSFPHVTLERVQGLLAPAMTIALLGAIESLLSAVVSDGLVGDRHRPNTELIGQGIANFVCPFFCGLPATGAIARTSANVGVGGRSPVAGMVHALVLLALVLLLSPCARFIPLAGIAGVLVMVCLRMGEWHELTRLGRMPRSDAAVLVATFALTVMFDLVVAVEIGMLIAGALFIRRIAETTEVSRVTSRDELETPEQVAHGKEIPEGVLVYRVFGPLFFGAAEKMEDALLGTAAPPKVLILRMQLVPAMDATALNILESVVERMQAQGATVILSGLHRHPLQLIAKAGAIDRIGRRNLCAHFDEALERARQVLASAP